MSYGLTANDWGDDAQADVGDDQAADAMGVSEWGLTVLPPGAPAQVRRSAMVPVAFTLPLILAALSYASGGLGFVSDLAFLSLTLICAILLVVELLAFGQRQGIGAILIYGGILIWFCHDYYSNWFLHDFTRYHPFFPGVRVETVARALFYHCLFIELMVIAFRFPILRFADRLVVAVPEPPDSRFYLGLVIAMLLFGWSGFWFTADALPVSLAKACLWFVPQIGPPVFTVGRTGNINYNWGGYVAQIFEVGQIGGILGAVYALLVARSLATRIFGWLDWVFWTSYSFTSYRRGDIAFMALPVLGLMFLRFHAQRDPERRARNFKWLLGTLAAAGILWVGVQKQTADRSNNAALDLTRAAGNTMFSEGLNTWVIIPEQVPYPYNTFVGEGALRALPDSLWWLVTGPIPRAIWTTKPVEQFALWYSGYISKDKRGVETGGVTGTTVATGAVGYWYFRYGPAGVIEGGLLYGWLMGVAERSLRRAQGRPIKVLFALSYATFMFRCYRDLWWHNLYPIMLGGIVLTIIIRVLFSGARPAVPLLPAHPVDA